MKPGIDENLTVKTVLTARRRSITIPIRRSRFSRFPQTEQKLCIHSSTGTRLRLTYPSCSLMNSMLFIITSFPKALFPSLKKMTNTQVILTSHNTNLLTNRIMRPDCYFLLTKDKLTSLANATPRDLREGHNLEKLYMSGEFNV